MPLTPTNAQSEASRVNGASSRGPTSDAGKATSAGNAVRHGLAGRRITLDEREAARLAALRDDYATRLRPVGPLEEAAVATMAMALVRTERADAVEIAVWDAIAREDAGGWPQLSTIMRYRARIAREHREAMAELQRLQQQRRAIASPAAAAPACMSADARTNEPDAVRTAPGASPADGPRPAPTPPRHLNRHERRRLEALERRHGVG